MPSKDSEEMEHDEPTLGPHDSVAETDLDPDGEFGGTEARKRLEKKLLLKLDVRMSILVVIYILNYVSRTRRMSFCCESRYELRLDR